MEIRTDFLVIGSGIAGLSFALKAARRGTVSIITKREAQESATYYAQGGIAAVFGPDDSFEEHIEDTIKAGAGLCDPEVVKRVVRDGPGRIRELIHLGAHFSETKNDGTTSLDLTQEGGHSKRRVVHAGDMTGKEVENSLLDAVMRDKNITVYNGHIAIDLITHSKFVKAAEQTAEPDTVWGAYALGKDDARIDTFLAGATVLATGGAGKVYIYSTNPDVATGDGIAMAYRAGAAVINMEFMQFHPTCLYHPEAKAFLISEALRGEGGILKLAGGRPFMKNHHPMADLAPRDIVARAIDYELKKSGADCVFLDMTSRTPRFLKDRFPNIFEKCLEFGYDFTSGLIPVVPAAHYICGGVKTDGSGRSSLKNLYAIGESACTGLHGANRLASNSLLEGLAFADYAASDAIRSIGVGRDIPKIPSWEPGGAEDSDEAVVITQNWDEIRRFMWNYVGIVRSDRRLERAKRRINTLKQEINDYYWDFTVTSDLVELRNIATVAELIIESARERKESRGLHFNLDYPERDDAFQSETLLVTAGPVDDREDFLKRGLRL